MTKDAAKPLAAGFMGAIPFVHQLLQNRGSHLSLSAGKRGIVSRSGYSMPWYLLALYGALILIGVSQLASGLCGAAAALAEVPKSDFILIAMLGTIPTMIFAYLIGTWIGARSERKGLLAILIAAVSVPIFDRAFAFIVMGRKEMGIVFQNESVFVLFVIPIAALGLLLTVPGLFGYWRGRRMHLSRYLGYLLRALPEDCRETLVNLAYDEAKRLAPRGAAETKPSTA
jgi:hypothetical protein